jgi:hypothetical protein
VAETETTLSYDAASAYSAAISPILPDELEQAVPTPGERERFLAARERELVLRHAFAASGCGGSVLDEGARFFRTEAGETMTRTLQGEAAALVASAHADAVRRIGGAPASSPGG